MLLPWLRALDAERGWRGSLLSAWALSVGYTAAVFAWLGGGIGAYTQIGAPAGLALLLLAAPLFQPQILVFALVRHLIGRRLGPLPGGLAACLAWLSAEWLLPRLLDDTLGYGLHPATLLRQAADLGGASGLTLALLLGNEALSAALRRHGHAGGWRAAVLPLAGAAALPALLAAYGALALARLPAPDSGPLLRLGLVQSNIADYERLRREQGAGAVVREVLDLHYAMSHDAVERQRADAVLWAETVYPTTFGRPKSEAGAEFDREILSVVEAAGRPFVFGTYERDAQGREYNSAAFVAPGRGLLGHYRKTRPFPLTEHVPAWLDGPRLRALLPWAGNWQPGDGARVFPLLLADGREVPVLPLICLDALDAGLAIDGARLGARAILTLSNDAWFSSSAQGPALHQAAAAFRSIETRLPQFRVTSTGYSGLIDASGEIHAATRWGERALAVGALPVGEPPPTLMRRWGDWVGPLASALLALLLLGLLIRALQRRVVAEAPVSARAATLPVDLALLPGPARWAAAALRVGARAGLLWMIWAILFGEGPVQSNTLAQLRSFVALFLVPEAAAWCLLRAYAARLELDAAAGLLRFTRGGRQLSLPLAQLAGVRPWRLPLPGAGASLRLSDGHDWRYGLACADPWALAQALRAVGGPSAPATPAQGLALYLRSRPSPSPGGLGRPWVKYLVFPFLLALPAFRLHQHIAYGSGLGEYYSFGLAAYLKGFSLWWAAWAMAVALSAAALRLLVELALLGGALLRPGRLAPLRTWAERLALAALYLGLPGWLLLRALS
ncbi:apolipoprotein N-acyltransferase [Roseateles sp. DAIF2]|nr:apolipoprotein N-acyltransferase [Roseateles sp. DAIF2]